MDPKTKELVESAEQRAMSATPGPWIQPLPDEPRAVVSSTSPTVSLLGLDADGMAIVECDEDAAFIAHARTDVPALCAAVREQDKLIDSLRAHREALGTRCDELDSRIVELEAQLKERDAAAKAWDALAVARLKTINEQTERIQRLEEEVTSLRE